MDLSPFRLMQLFDHRGEQDFSRRVWLPFGTVGGDPPVEAAAIGEAEVPRDRLTVDTQRRIMRPSAAKAVRDHARREVVEPVAPEGASRRTAGPDVTVHLLRVRLPGAARFVRPSGAGNPQRPAAALCEPAPLSAGVARGV